MRLRTAGLALLAPSALAQSITISNGTIQGGSCPSSAANYYHAIPFAQPPLGSLRFAAPQPVDQKFNGTLNGTKVTPTCIQFGGDFTEPQPWSEDCLYLNVWAPKHASSDSKLPVKVWVYGGGNTGGGISDPLYDGCNAATDSIVVSINYRLGPLGFLALEDAGLSGNYAVQDLLLGLRWVQENIEAFGGDRSKVLLFGQSAGAALSFLISTLAEAPSLISAVAAESGGGRGSIPYAEAQPYFRAFVKNLGCALNDLDCMRSKSPQELNASFPVDLTSATIPQAYARGFASVIDGKVVPKDPAAVGSRVPAIFGSTSNDGSLFILAAYRNNFPPTEANYTSLIESNFGPYASTVKSYYPISRFANISSASLAPYFAMTAIWTHASYTCSTQRGLKRTTAKGVPAYAYVWDVAPSCSWLPNFSSGISSQILELLGVAHTSEIPFVLRNTEQLPPPNGTCSFSATERNISDAVSSAWTAMARAQSPYSPLLPGSWPTFSTNGTKGLVATQEGLTFEDIDYSFCKLWDSISESMLTNGTTLKALSRRAPSLRFIRRYTQTPNLEMKIAITGSRGTVGQYVVKAAVDAGHSIVQVNRTEQDPDGTKNSEYRTADTAKDYDATVQAFKGCDAVIHLAAIPDPVDKSDSLVHSNNVESAFNGFRACGELGIKKICYASSVNAVGLAYANQPLKFKYFPIDEEYPPNPTDAYALAKVEAETQAKAFVNWFPGTKISCLRIHEVAPKKDVQKEHEENWDEAAVGQLWAWVSPAAVARACLLSVEKADAYEGCEIFNIVAPETTQKTTSAELAKKYYPEAEVRKGLEGNKGFWTIDKAERILGWKHEEKE
ncbi:hypothetical protein SLS60_001428 [Paraconiothyrium brasiliense]|uniref:Uncharacterized protein n=1 Tax=Paraconiothyrium brasiliense TaxID=300254 RepID=A0ABR3S921_9PLEO